MAKVPDVVIGEPLIDKNEGTVAATEVTVPPGLLELIVWFGQVPVMLTLVPATNAGVAVPVPPLASATMPVTLAALPVILPVTALPAIAMAVFVTPVTCPCALVVKTGTVDADP